MSRVRLVSAAHEFSTLWGCQPDGEMFFTASSLLWPVQVAGEKAMLEIARPDNDEAQSADILRFYNGHGAVKLLRSHENIQLLERADNKASLEKMAINGEDDDALGVICNVIAKLHADVAIKKPPSRLIPFLRRSDGVRQSVQKELVKDEERILFEGALHVVEEGASLPHIPLHGDIHHNNVLSSSRGWLAIDPKGVLGPQAYDYANLLCNPYPAAFVAQPDRMDKRADIIIQQSGLDKNLLLRLTYLHAVQAAAWALQDNESAAHWISCARAAQALQ